jgi:hypothetical protein
MSAVQLEARNATAQDLVKILNEQQAHKLDVVVPALNMRAQNGLIQVKGAEISEDGVTSLNGTYRPTEIFDDGVAAKLGIPRQYLRKMREERTDLYDKNVNGWLRGQMDPATGATVHAADDRAFLLRLFRGNGDAGVARAFLSDRYGITMDNLDILTAVMKGIQDAGQQPLVRVTDLSERAMRVRFEFPDVNALAPGLLNGYKSPFGEGGVKRAGAFDELRQQYGAHHIFSDDTAPIAFMGFDLRNSETGGGAYSLSPVVEMVKCTNGWTITKEGIRKVHLGARLEQGHVRASAQTARKAGELVASETQDAVSQWLTTGYLEELIAGLEAKASKPIVKASETVPAIVTGLGFSEDEAKGVLDLFVLSGQPTAGGLAQAVSAFAQTVEDVDRAYEIELATVPALDAAAAA